MSKAIEKALKKYPVKEYVSYGPYPGASGPSKFDDNTPYRIGFIEGYRQAEKDIKEKLSNLFQEFMLDCIKDDTETHILHFVDVFNNKIKTIGNE